MPTLFRFLTIIAVHRGSGLRGDVRAGVPGEAEQGEIVVRIHRRS
jgi:hypothetical protein